MEKELEQHNDPSRCLLHNVQINEIRTTLYGNGRAGLLERHNRMETTMRVTAGMVGILLLTAVPTIIEIVHNMFEILGTVIGVITYPFG